MNPENQIDQKQLAAAYLCEFNHSLFVNNSTFIYRNLRFEMHAFHEILLLNISAKHVI